MSMMSRPNKPEESDKAASPPQGQWSGIFSKWARSWDTPSSSSDSSRPSSADSRGPKHRTKWSEIMNTLTYATKGRRATTAFSLNPLALTRSVPGIWARISFTILKWANNYQNARLAVNCQLRFRRAAGRVSVIFTKKGRTILDLDVSLS